MGDRLQPALLGGVFIGVLAALVPCVTAPPALFDVMQGHTSRFIGMADREMRAYLGELHDAESPPCITLGRMMRGVYGGYARRSPHHYATVAILRALDPDDDSEPAIRLGMLCDLPEAELRRRIASAWQKLYDSPLPPGKPAARARRWST